LAGGTILISDLDRAGMMKALRAFRDEADKADWALVYFRPRHRDERRQLSHSR
jgi:hypothetical protein